MGTRADEGSGGADASDRHPEIRRAETASQANEWALVLSAAGIASRVVRRTDGFALEVHREDAARATAEIAAHQEEAAAAEALRASRSLTVPAEARGPVAIQVALLVSLSMIGFYGITGERRADMPWFLEGSADSSLIRAGELWRTVTALTLHADLSHLVANVLFGTLFLWWVGRNLGPGVGLALVVLAGAGANAVNAFLRSSSHVSIGASTAVFGAVGLLCGIAIVGRVRQRDRWRRVVVPFAGGLGILAMIGSGEGRVDVFAHLFGLLVGTALGLGAGLAVKRPPGPAMQIAGAALAVVAVVGSWQLARS